MIMDLHDAMENPSSVGYEFKTKNALQAYKNRWVHSFNAFVGADMMVDQFLSKYTKLPFNQGKDAKDMVPVFMGEYGNPHLAKEDVKLEADLKAAIAIVRDKTNPFIGINFFQFMIAYWKPCTNVQAFDDWLAKAWT